MRSVLSKCAAVCVAVLPTVLCFVLLMWWLYPWLQPLLSQYGIEFGWFGSGVLVCVFYTSAWFAGKIEPWTDLPAWAYFGYGACVIALSVALRVVVAGLIAAGVHELLVVVIGTGLWVSGFWYLLSRLNRIRETMASGHDLAGDGGAKEGRPSS